VFLYPSFVFGQFSGKEAKKGSGSAAWHFAKIEFLVINAEITKLNKNK
jgi:hypothetical protein